jgi:polysaccharide pyruvyl transferase WcaK-like protein
MVKRDVISTIDPAICLKSELKEKKRRIGISFVPYFDPRYWPNPDEQIYRKYIKVMANTINKLLCNYEHDIIFFSTNFPRDIRTAVDVYDRIFFKERINVIEKQLKVKEIISLTSSFELLISSRLHSIIFSAIAKTPFVAIAYQPKVNSFCKMLSMDDYVVNLDNSINIDVNNFLNKISAILKSKKSIELKLDDSIKKLKKLNELNNEIVFSICSCLQDGKIKRSLQTG